MGERFVEGSFHGQDCPSAGVEWEHIRRKDTVSGERKFGSGEVVQ